MNGRLGIHPVPHLRTAIRFALVAVPFALIAQPGVAQEGPAKPPVKVYILSGQSNMVGMGDIRGRTSRWGKEFIDPVVSIYPGEYSPAANYDELTPIETKKLAAFGGVRPTPFPKGGTAVVRGFIEMPSSGEYKFSPGYGESTVNIMEVGGKEVYRRPPGQEAVRAPIELAAGTRYAFMITFLTQNANGLGWVWRTDIPGLLTTLVHKDEKFPHLIDEQGNWTVRDDVMYQGVISAVAKGPLTVGLQGNTIGPELQFGHVVGAHHDEPVLIIKASIGNRSLGWDYLPPGSERYTIEGTTYAGHGDSPASWPEGEEPRAINWYAGKQYDDCVKAVHGVLDRFAEHFPRYEDRGYEIAGFVWWQGHKDGNAVHAGRYEQNLVRLIKCLREEFEAPAAPFVIATIGFGGWKMAGPHLRVAEAQLAVSGERGKYPEFAGNVLTVETRDFWRETAISPSGQGYHYNRNAETYMLVGDALGRGMVRLLEGKQKPPAPGRSKELARDFLKLKLGMFIHYNLATYKETQWVAGYHSPADFNPGVETVDTDAWADAAVSAGMTYGVLTAKHVSGFCLWDSEHTNYDVMHPECPYKKDLVAQFIESFQSRGLKVGLYYCWRHPGFGDPEKFKVLPPECDPATHGLEEQLQFQLDQIAELLERYPEVFYLWNDALDDELMPAAAMLDRVRRVRPDVLTSSNWWNWGKKGRPYADIAIKEMRHFPESNRAPGETCFKLEQKWFWQRGARPGSAKGALDHMARALGRKSNFLLNVGPDPSGNILEPSAKVLAEIGKLLKASKSGSREGH